VTDLDDVISAAKALPPEVIRDVYRDLPSPALKQFGRFGEDFVKALRLVAFPVQILGAYQDRLEKYLDQAIRNVPEKNIIKPVQSIVLPIVEKLRFQEEENPITVLYINLLSRAMDGERVGEAHPAFLGIVQQLAPDEALFLKQLATAPYVPILRLDSMWTTPDREIISDMINKGQANMPAELKKITQKIMFKYDALNQPELFPVFLEHLVHIGLVEYTNDPHNPGGKFAGYLDLRHEERKFLSFFFIRLTNFGTLFHKACVSESKG